VVDFGGPDALRVLDLPEPHAGLGQVRVRVRAAAVNPTDTWVRNGAVVMAQVRAGKLAAPTPPYVPGMDAAGVLDEIGDGVETDLVIGDHVMAIVVPSGAHGAYSDYVVLPAESVVKVPAGVEDGAASTLPMNGLTARLTLDLLGLAPGRTLAVTGAAGCYGGYVVQLAKADGLRVVADASEADRDLVASLGADVIVPRGPDVAEDILAAVPGGVDALADGSVQNMQVVPAVRDGGGIAAVRGFEGGAGRGITVHPVWVREYARERAKLDRLRQQVEDGVLTLRVASGMPAAKAAEAHRMLEAGGTRGRIVLEF
jgi:NADPH:quinone reductase-like Zn-dependent oxidoreductase